MPQGRMSAEPDAMLQVGHQIEIGRGVAVEDLPQLMRTLMARSGSLSNAALLHQGKVVSAGFAAPHPSLLDLSILASALVAFAPARATHPITSPISRARSSASRISRGVVKLLIIRSSSLNCLSSPICCSAHLANADARRTRP